MEGVRGGRDGEEVVWELAPAGIVVGNSFVNYTN